MATSGRKKAEKKAPPKMLRYEDGSKGASLYKAATPTGASNRSAVAKKPGTPAKRRGVSDSASPWDIWVQSQSAPGGKRPPRLTPYPEKMQPVKVRPVKKRYST